VIYESSNWRENTFVFTLDANEEMQGESGDNFYNCMCIVFSEFLRRESDGKVFLVDKAYCLMFANNYFHAHFEVMVSLLQFLKFERFQILTEQSAGMSSIEKEIEADIQVTVSFCH